jgi:UDP-N-acetylglucosamine 2-epimerase (hydrolysing)
MTTKSSRKNIVFLTGTRADFGKLKTLISNLYMENELFNIYIFVTGMHMLKEYGSTWEEVREFGIGKLYYFINQNRSDSMDAIIGKTITGLSDYIKEIDPDLILVHGDRIESLAGAIVGCLNNTLVAHVEGGEISGTVDDLIRHSVTKLAHIHFVSNMDSKNRLLQLGEQPKSIFIIGSPEIDILNSPDLPNLNEVLTKYEITFNDYILFIFHPVTTEVHNLDQHLLSIKRLLTHPAHNFLVIQSNNDFGSEKIKELYKELSNNKNIRILPSMRFEYYLTALKNAKMIIGNSSSGVRESSYFGVPAINLGTRQKGRSESKNIINCDYDFIKINDIINKNYGKRFESTEEFGEGESGSKFKKVLSDPHFWQTAIQKTFKDI